MWCDDSLMLAQFSDREPFFARVSLPGRTLEAVLPVDLDGDGDHDTDRRSLDLWSDGETVWILHEAADGTDSRINAFGVRDGRPRSKVDIDLSGLADPMNATSIWSDGETIWITTDETISDEESRTVLSLPMPDASDGAPAPWSAWETMGMYVWVQFSEPLEQSLVTLNRKDFEVFVSQSGRSGSYRFTPRSVQFDTQRDDRLLLVLPNYVQTRSGDHIEFTYSGPSPYRLSGLRDSDGYTTEAFTDFAVTKRPMPVTPRAWPEGGNLKVEWSRSRGNNAFDEFNSYLEYKEDDADTCTGVIDPVDPAGGSRLIGGLEGGTTYLVRLFAANVARPAWRHTERQVTMPVIPVIPDPPGPPKDVTMTSGPGLGQVKVTWSAPASTNPPTPVRGYRLSYRCTAVPVNGIGDRTNGEGRREGVLQLAGHARGYTFRELPAGASCALGVAVANEGGRGNFAYQGDDSSAVQYALSPPEAPAAINVEQTLVPDGSHTEVTWDAPSSGATPASYEIAYWDVNVGSFEYVAHSDTAALSAVIEKAPADLRTVAVRAVGATGAPGPWVTGWDSTATPSKLDAMTQSSSLSLSLTHSEDGTAGVDIPLAADAKCFVVGGVYVDTAMVNDKAWIVNTCARVDAFDIASDGSLTLDADASLTMDELYGFISDPEKERKKLMPGPEALWFDSENLWIADRSMGKILAHRLSDGARLADRMVKLIPRNTMWHSFVAPSGIWSDGNTMWVVDAFFAGLVWAVSLDENLRPDDRAEMRFVPSGLDGCYVPQAPRYEGAFSYNHPIEGCSSGMALRDAIDAGLDQPVGAYSDGRWLWVAVRFYHSKTAKILAFNLLTGERASSRDIELHPDNTMPGGIHSDDETLWVTDKGTERLYTYAIPQED